jgi:pimeloyl-ACP methyl ester carboxylesterase
MINKVFKWTLIAISAVVLLLLLGALVYRDIPTAELEAKYATPASKYLEVDGVRVHYRDEGTGPAVMLIHAHFASLLMWEPWAEALRDRYRVVRFDMTSHGLTGPDPSGDYSLTRTVALFEQFADRLGLERFALVGTSLGGTVAMHYTSRHPGRVDRLILISPGALNARTRGQSKPPEIPRIFDVLTVVTPRWLASTMLKGGFGDPSKSMTG